MKAAVRTDTARPTSSSFERSTGRSHGRRGAGTGSRGLRQPGGLVRPDGHAVGRARPARAPKAEDRQAGSRLRRHGGSGRQGRHAVSPGRRGVRRQERRLRRVRLRSRIAVALKPAEPDTRAGGGRARRGAHRAAGSSRQGTSAGRAEGPDQRRLGRRRHVRRADRQGTRSGGDRRVQHEERRPRALDRRRSRHRLHAGGLHAERRAIRPDARHRGQQVVVGVQARARARRRRSSSSARRRATV